MMSSVEMISNILNDFFKSESIIKLEEEEAGMFVDFISERQRFLSFRMDKKLEKRDFPNGLFPFFNKGLSEVCSMCDYIIFSEYRGKLFILLIELKKGRNNVTKQLEAGECFVKYIVDTMNRVYEKNIVPEIRKISIREFLITKRCKSAQKQKEIQYDKDNLCTFKDSKFYLKKYLV